MVVKGEWDPFLKSEKSNFLSLHGVSQSHISPGVELSVSYRKILVNTYSSDSIALFFATY